MAQNYIQPGDQALTVVAPVGGTTSGVPLRLAAGVVKIVIPLATAAAGVEVECATQGVYRLAKEAPLVINQFEAVYWDDTAKKVTKTTTNNFLMGYAAYPAVSAATTVDVYLTP